MFISEGIGRLLCLILAHVISCEPAYAWWMVGRAVELPAIRLPKLLVDKASGEVLFLCLIVPTCEVEQQSLRRRSGGCFILQKRFRIG